MRRRSRRRSASSTSGRAIPITQRRALWDDGIIDPADTRTVLATGARSRPQRAAARADPVRHFQDVMVSLARRFGKLLIANRGEIACRIVRTAKRMGLPTVAVFSDADRDAMHVALADEAVRIGPAPAKESYLRIDAIIEAAQTTGAEAVHPGYGFLSENADFAQACAEAGLVFVGPSAETIRLMGSKSAAKALMEVVRRPGRTRLSRRGPEHCRPAAAADRIGYPVLVKAVGGRRRPGHADRRQRRGARRSARRRQARGGCAVRQRSGPDREIHRQAAPHRGAGVRRQPRQRGVAVRARMHPAAPPSEGGGGGSFHRDHLRAARRDVGGGARGSQAARYVGAGTVEFIVDAARLSTSSR